MPEGILLLAVCVCVCVCVRACVRAFVRVLEFMMTGVCVMFCLGSSSGS